MDKPVKKENYTVRQEMRGSGIANFSVPPGYSWVALVNSSDNIVTLHQERTSKPDELYALVSCSPFSQRTFPIVQGNNDFTLSWNDGGGIDTKVAMVVFSTENLTLNGSLNNQFEGVFSIGSDGVGLARQSQFPAALGSTGGIKTEITNAPSVFIAGDPTIKTQVQGTVPVSGTVGVSGTVPVSVGSTVTVSDNALGTAESGVTNPGTAKYGWLSGIYKHVKIFADAIGSKIDIASALPAGGSGLMGWLSRIWYQVSIIQGSQLPGALSNSGGVKMSPNGQSFWSFTAAASQQLKNSPGVLHRVIISTPATATSTMTLYNNNAASGAKIATIDLQGTKQVIDFDVAVNSLYVVIAGAAADVQVTYE